MMTKLHQKAPMDFIAKNVTLNAARREIGLGIY